MSSCLLVINCNKAEHFESNRQVLSDIYADKFDRVMWTVPAGTEVPPPWRHRVRVDYRTVENMAGPALVSNTGESLPHQAYRPRYHLVTSAAADHDFVVCTEDDCLINPRWNTKTVAKRMHGIDAYLSPIRLVSRQDVSWDFTQHDSGYPSLDSVAHQIHWGDVYRNWKAYTRGGSLLVRPPTPSAFSVFQDFGIFATEPFVAFSRAFDAMNVVWQEIAVAVAVLSVTQYIGIANGITLWGDRREEMSIDMLKWADFLHPVKLSNTAQNRLASQYGALRPGKS